MKRIEDWGTISVGLTGPECDDESNDASFAVAT